MSTARKILCIAAIAALGLPLLAWGATIAPGEVRVVVGKISAVDVAYRAVVVEVPTPKGDLTVGVTLADTVTPRVDGQPIALSDISVGQTARLKYTREDDRLIGLDLVVRR